MPFDEPTAEPIDVQDLAADKLRKKREGAMWYAVIGVGLLFAGSISTALSVGGAVMVLYGIAVYIYWSVKIAGIQHDPWKDPELDAWEDEHYGDPSDAPEVITESPDAAWGGKR